MYTLIVIYLTIDISHIMLQLCGRLTRATPPATRKHVGAPATRLLMQVSKTIIGKGYVLPQLA